MMDVQYYQEMLKKNRLIPIIVKNELKGIITFYIGNDEDKYIRDNPWSVVDDEPEEGKVCFVDQLITYGINPKKSFRIFNNFRKIIRQAYPQVEKIRWNRYKRIWNTAKRRDKVVKEKIPIVELVK